MYIVALVAAPGCGSSDPTSSLPRPQADAVQALKALNAKTSINNGKVTYVDFYGIPDVTSGVEHLKSLPDLEKLNFSSTNLTDAALVHLAGLAELKELGLWGTRVTDGGLVHLAALNKLESLNLNDTAVTDAGLAHLEVLTALKKLYLNKTKVTDAGLTHLAGLEQLEYLDVYDTPVTAAGAAQFRTQRPNIEIAVTDDEGEAEIPASEGTTPERQLP
jgi:Leucine-rich repeat (LRR) protein